MSLPIWLREHFPAYAELLELPAPAGGWMAPAPDTERDRALAWRIHTELRTRITTQQLGFRSGDDVAASNSIGEFFKLAREAVAESGPSGTAELVVLLLNDTLRPFTSRWHRGSERGLLARDDGRRRFRVELEELRLRLRWWDALFRHIADGSPVGPLPALDRREQPPELRVRGPETLCTPTIAEAEHRRIPETERTRFAIAFSGGGIRSASFCMGVMLGLARTKIYESADYVSSVSGGGYLVTLLRSARTNAPGLGVNPLRTPPVGEPALLTQVRARSNSMWDDWPLALKGLGRAWGLSARVTLPRLRVVVALLSAGTLALAGLGAGWDFALGLGVVFAATLALLRWWSGRWPRWDQPDLDAFSPAAFYVHYLKRIWVVEPGSAAARAGERLVKTGGGRAAANSNRPIFLRNAAHNRAARPHGTDDFDTERLADVATFTGDRVEVCGSAPEVLWHGTSDEDVMAISGAAVAPSMGVGTRWWLRPLLALLGLRLGRWIQVVAVDERNREVNPVPSGAKPPLSLFRQELYGLPDPTHRFRYFSDGGHIENLGVYALLRRRVPYILAVDGEADPTMAFDGLRQLQRLARIDLGVELDIDTADLAPDGDGLSNTHVAIIRIRYPEIREGGEAPRPGDPGKLLHAAAQGVIVYVKSSMTGDEPSDVLGYKQAHPSFPHESTMIQWFDERQFEAYRALGEHVARQLIAPEWLGPSAPKVEDLEGPSWVQWLRSRVEQA